MDKRTSSNTRGEFEAGDGATRPYDGALDATMENDAARLEANRMMATPASTKRAKAKRVKAKRAKAIAGEGEFSRLTYVETKAAVGEAARRLNALRDHLASLEAAFQAGEQWQEAAKHPFMSDEGISVAWLSAQRLMNLATEKVNARRFSVSVNGRVYNHVGNSPGGHWVYRAEK